MCITISCEGPVIPYIKINNVTHMFVNEFNRLIAMMIIIRLNHNYYLVSQFYSFWIHTEILLIKKIQNYLFNMHIYIKIILQNIPAVISPTHKYSCKIYFLPRKTTPINILFQIKNLSEFSNCIKKILTTGIILEDFAKA